MWSFRRKPNYFAAGDLCDRYTPRQLFTFILQVFLLPQGLTQLAAQLDLGDNIPLLRRTPVRPSIQWDNPKSAMARRLGSSLASALTR